MDGLLNSWITVEILEPQTLPTPKDLKGTGRRLVRTAEHPEPWRDRRHGLAGSEKQVYWWAYLGEIELSEVMPSLLALFPDDSPEPPPRSRGTVPLAVVVLDGEGRPQEAKSTLASFAWGYGKVRSGHLAGLAAFPEEQRFLCESLEKRLIRQDEDGEVLSVSVNDLREAARWLADRLLLPVEQVSFDPVLRRVPQRRQLFEAPEPELVNSFFLEDLAKVRDAFRTADVGPALQAFLGKNAGEERRDVVRQPEILKEVLAPARTPLARWPAPGDHPLVMMQQAAVNHVAGELSESGLVGINGPPGTGKTTLLRDVVGHVVLQRARVLAEFNDPQDAFSHGAPIKIGRSFLHLYRIDPRLSGFEIVVASSNNQAVENVSREIPRLVAVQREGGKPCYFASIADRIASEDDRKEIEKSCWGLAAAVLGRRSNVHDFAGAFWWDPQWSMQKLLRGIVDGWSPQPDVGEPEPAAAEDEGPARVLVWEGAPLDLAEARRRWEKARRRFNQDLAEATAVQDSLESVRQALEQRRGVETRLAEVETEIAALHATATKAAAEVAVRSQALERSREAEAAALADRDLVYGFRPGFLARLFAVRSYREWRGRMKDALAEVDKARSEARTAADHFDQAKRAQDCAAEALRQNQALRSRLQARLTEVRSVLAEAEQSLGERLPDARFWDRPDEERQKVSPWLGKRFQDARKKLFHSAFALQEAFVLAAARPLRHNLGVMMALLKGRRLKEEHEQFRSSLWASLCLVVPVISTTFASAARLFGPLGREQLGWLLIDEAGQAAPQAAVGSIWRFRRTIAIGDPLQIEPVVTMPQRLIDAVFRTHEEDADSWAAPGNSVQSLADRSSWFGTLLHQSGGEVWVGAPLRVHRRCQQPMFGISNRVAYDSLMVQATEETASPVGEILGPSAWFDVPGNEPGHWASREGEVAAGLLRVVVEELHEVPDIFFITPFRLCQVGLRSRLPEVVAPVLQRSGGRRWSKDAVGTIHTFQGREADTVVLVLGAPSLESQGARFWAGGSPNLLNVAVSRAKRRLYVVGDWEAWRTAGVFRHLAVALPRKTWAVQP